MLHAQFFDVVTHTHTQYDESSRFVLIYTQYLKKLCIYCCLGYERHQQTAALSKTWLYKVLALALDHFWSCSSNSAALTSSQFSSAEYSIPSMYVVHSMLCSSIVVGIQAQPDSISLSQLYYDRSKGYLSSIIHNKNHNATRYFRAKLWLWLSLIQFFSPPRGIWLVASNMEYDGCRQLRYCCCAMPGLAGCCSSFYTARTLHRRIKLWTPGKNDFQNAGPPSS